MPVSHDYDEYISPNQLRKLMDVRRQFLSYPLKLYLKKVKENL